MLHTACKHKDVSARLLKFNPYVVGLGKTGTGRENPTRAAMACDTSATRRPIIAPLRWQIHGGKRRRVELKHACVKSHNPISKIAAAHNGGIRCYRKPEVLLPGISAVAWNLLTYALFSRQRYGGLTMKPNRPFLLGISTLAAGLVFAPPLFAQTESSSTTTTNTAPAGSGAAGSSTTTTTTSSDGTATNGGATQSVENAAHSAKVDTENAYHHVKSDVKDVTLEAKVKSMLHENKDTRGADVHVTADHGVVTLTGTVVSKVQAVRAEQVAANVYGVRRVRDRLHYPDHERAAGTASSSASE
jgi:hypothetical protein